MLGSYQHLNYEVIIGEWVVETDESLAKYSHSGVTKYNAAISLEWKHYCTVQNFNFLNQLKFNDFKNEVASFSKIILNLFIYSQVKRQLKITYNLCFLLQL